MTEHKDYDGKELRCTHLGLKGKAWAQWAWDDWYYIHVQGTWANGNEAKGVYCREQAHTVGRYLKGE
jgi:hypothetical protein